MITLQWIYTLAGAVFFAFAVLSVTDRQNGRRFINGAFWGLLALSFLFGDRLTDLANGVLVIGLVGLAAVGLGQGKPKTTTAGERAASAARLGNRLFIPALIIPVVALLGTLVLAKLRIGDIPLFDPKDPTLIALGLGAVLAVTAGMIMFRPPALAPLQEGRRLMDSVGWAAILPQMLAALGAVFALAGVGQVVGGLVADVIPMNGPLIAVIAYCLGMALFTVIMGNAFAAFPVMTAALGLPFVVGQFGGNPAIVCAIGMLAGFCGTLMTPMAANFNVVPANLLELPDRNAAFNGVIRAQIPTALIMLGINIALMYALAFRF